VCAKDQLVHTRIGKALLPESVRDRWCDAYEAAVWGPDMDLWEDDDTEETEAIEERGAVYHNVDDFLDSLGD
jgi:hypothetical protein